MPNYRLRSEIASFGQSRIVGRTEYASILIGDITQVDPDRPLQSSL